MEDDILQFAGQKRLVALLERQLAEAKIKLDNMEKQMAKNAFRAKHGREWSALLWNDEPLLW